jgi:hypothetical protein
MAPAGCGLLLDCKFRARASSVYAPFPVAFPCKTRPQAFTHLSTAPKPHKGQSRIRNNRCVSLDSGTHRISCLISVSSFLLAAARGAGVCPNIEMERADLRR